MAKTVEHLSDFVFVSMANLTLARQDSYLSPLISGIKPNTIAALRRAPLNMATLFPDNIIKKGEEDIDSFESKGHSSSSPKKGHYHPHERQEKCQASIMSSQLERT